MSAPALEPGDVMLTATGDVFGWLIRLVTRSSVNHAAVVVDGGMMVEMQPSGACLSPTSRYPQAVWFRPPGTDAQRATMASAASHLYERRAGYGFVDLIAQFAYRTLHIRPNELARVIGSSGRMVCSQSVDWCAEQAGIQLFADGRLPGLVSPGDLLTAAKAGEWLLAEPPGALRAPSRLGAQVLRFARLTAMGLASSAVVAQVLHGTATRSSVTAALVGAAEVAFRQIRRGPTTQ